ncbi:MAG: TatD family hydrolase [Bacteroidia bacterium]|nr:TatD family hydrolase [Bacteroidia bacterium]
MFKQNFINVHSHHKPLNENEFVIRNAYLHSISGLPSNYSLSIGIHPWFISKITLDQSEKKMRLLLAQPNFMAIGEIGLDKLKPYWTQQLIYFEMQLLLAKEFNKPVIIHCVKAYNYLITFIKKSDSQFILHGYNGNLVQTKQLVKFENVYFSFGPKQLNVGDKIKEVLRIITPERIFIETDTQRIPVLQVYNKILPYFQLSLTALQNQIIANFIHVFKESNSS